MIKILGELKPDNGSDKTHIQNYVYDSLGIAPTLTARDYKDPRKVLVRSNNGSKSDRTNG